jgi:PA14 domain-containing protein
LKEDAMRGLPRKYGVLSAVMAATAAAFCPDDAAAQTGLTGEYYNNNAVIVNTMTPPGSPAPTNSGTASLTLTRTDAPVPNFVFDWGTGSPDPAVTADDFFVVWRGDIRATASGAWTFGTRADDGTRVWVNGTLVLDNWVDQAPPVAPNMGATTVTLTAGKAVAIRVEYYERGGGAVFELWWQAPGGAPVAVPTSALSLPASAPAAAALTASAGYTGTGSPQVSLNWSAPAGATDYDVSRSTTMGGPYGFVASTTATSYNDTAVSFGTTYYYVVRAFAGSTGGPNSNEASATPMPPPPKSSSSGGSDNLGHRCGCSTVGGPSALLTGIAALLALSIAVAFRR